MKGTFYLTSNLKHKSKYYLHVDVGTCPRAFCIGTEHSFLPMNLYRVSSSLIMASKRPRAAICWTLLTSDLSVDGNNVPFRPPACFEVSQAHNALEFVRSKFLDVINEISTERNVIHGENLDCTSVLREIIHLFLYESYLCTHVTYKKESLYITCVHKKRLDRKRCAKH